MKNLIRKWVLCLIVILTTGILYPKTTQARPAVGISFQIFYDNLEPYGRWINDREHGYVWIPNVEPGFQPYATRGHWIETSYGNTWVSDYPWGWAAFHYGRWHYDDFYGWEWIPDDVWGPAWVNWRSGNGYYGWTPLEPGININISINIPFSRWVFVPERYINHPQVYNYYVPRERGNTMINNTTVINNIYVNNNHSYVSGPRASEIERATHSRVPVYRINNESRPGYAVTQNGSVGLYRPEIDRRNDTSRPSHVTDAVNNRNQSPDRNAQGSNTNRNQTNSPRPDRAVSNSQENGNARITGNNNDRTSNTTNNSATQNNQDNTNRQRPDRITRDPNVNNSPNTRPDVSTSQQGRAPADNANSSAGRYSQQQQNDAAQRDRINAEQSRQSRQQASQQQADAAQRDRANADQSRYSRQPEQQARPQQPQTNAEQSRQSRQPGQQVSPQQPSRGQSNGKQPEKEKQQSSSGKDGNSRHRPERS